ncbi:MAG: trigger factor [Alphaproteobacteria bacterium]|nr:trigger factor [Alphaproteobacteria bacterium]
MEMQISVLKEDGLNRELEVVIPAATIQKKMDAELVNYSKNIRMDGFRKGKVPLALVKKQHGMAILGEVIDKALQESISQVMQQHNFRAANQPQIELGDSATLDETKDLSYKMKLEILPNVEPMDLSTVSIEKPIATPDEKAIEYMIERAGEYQRDTEVVSEDRGAQTGDICVIDFHGQTKDGVEMPGMSGDDMHVEIGKGRMIPGFEEQLIGHKVGEHVHIDVTFPEEYHAKELAGKGALFHADIKELRQPSESLTGEALAEKMGFETYEAMQNSARESVQKEYNELSYLRMKRVLFDILNEKHQFDLPASMVEAEYQTITKQMEEEKKREGAEISDADREELRPIAQRRVRLGLILAEIGRRNNIEVTRNELVREVYNRFGHFTGGDMNQIFNMLQKNQKLVDMIRAPLYEEKVVRYILSQLKTEEKAVTIEELTKLVDEEDQE